jgi:hypothetical protein
MKGCLIALKNFICCLFLIGFIYHGMHNWHTDTVVSLGFFALAVFVMWLWSLGDSD